MPGKPKYQVDEGHLDYCLSENQTRIVNLRLEGKTVNEIAKLLGTEATRVSRAIRSVVSRGAYSGYAPEFDMIRPVPPGFALRGTSTYYPPDPINKTPGQWVKNSAATEQREQIVELMREVSPALGVVRPWRPSGAPMHAG